MSDQSSSSKSWGSSVAIGIIILVLAVGLIFFIYYIFIQTPVNPFPVSPFKFGDTVQICPAIFCRETQTTNVISPNQYLVNNFCSSYPCDGCYQPAGSNEKSCVATFTGKQADPGTKWVLEQLPFTGTEYPAQSADQNVLQFGNRFYLRNSQISPSTVSGRLLMNLFDASTCASCKYGPDRTFPISTPDAASCTTCPGCYDPNTEQKRGNELVVYFWPSTQPDLYYILLPGSIGTLDCILRTDNSSVTSQPNNGVVSLRPYAPWDGGPTYNPYIGGSSVAPLYSNGMLLNGQGNYPVGVKYPSPEIFLFKVVKV